MCDGGDTRTRPPLDAIVPAQELSLYAPSCTWPSTGPTRVVSPIPIFHVDHTHSPCALTYTVGPEIDFSTSQSASTPGKLVTGRSPLCSEA